MTTQLRTVSPSLYTYRFVEHTRSPIFVFPVGAVYESVAEDVIVDTPIAALEVGRRTREPLHAVLRWRAL